jgi:hypothetical protein
VTERRSHLVPIDAIVRGLTDRIEDLCRVLLPAGRRDQDEWREASTRVGGLGDSFSVNITRGSRRGVWSHYGAGRFGDALDLVAYVRFNDDKRAAIDWAKAWLGLDGSNPEALKAATMAPARDPNADAKAREETQNSRNAAHSIYLSGGAIEGSPVEGYLLGRGLDVRRLGFPLKAIRCHPGLWDRYTARKWPAMVAAITSVDGKFLAVHRTFLEVLRDGSVRKAPIVDDKGGVSNKRALGAYSGGVIRLWRGTRVDPDTGEIKQARRLAQCKSGVWVDLTEGIEDGLTVAIADPEARVLCAVSVSNMGKVRLPACVEGVVLWRQNDAPGSEAENAMNKVVQHFQAEGKRVADCRPPAGIKDANDMVREANDVRLKGSTQG